MNHNNIHKIGIWEEEKEQGIENLSEEIMTKKSPNLVKGKDTSTGRAESPKPDKPK